MFANLPKILLPITKYTTYEEVLVGKVTFTENSNVVLGVGTKFTIQCTIGSELFNNDVSLGFIDEIIDDEQLVMDEPVEDSVVTTAAKVKIFDPSTLGVPLLVTDIFRRVVASERYTERSSALMPYRIIESETPELVSTKFYRSPFYHWVLLLINNIIDPREEWPVTELQLQEKLNIQYSTKLTGIIESSRNSDIVMGTDTMFMTELKVGDVILSDKTNKNIGRVEGIISNTAIRLTQKSDIVYSGKYKYVNNSDILYYREVDTKYIVDYDAARESLGEIEGVDIYTHVVKENDDKRLIKILKPTFLNDFISQYKVLINQTT